MGDTLPKYLGGEAIVSVKALFISKPIFGGNRNPLLSKCPPLAKSCAPHIGGFLGHKFSRKKDYLMPDFPKRCFSLAEVGKNSLKMDNFPPKFITEVGERGNDGK